MFYIRPLYLRRTTEEAYNTPFGVSEQRHEGRENEGIQERSRDVPDVVNKKETAIMSVDVVLSV